MALPPFPPATYEMYGKTYTYTEESRKEMWSRRILRPYTEQVVAAEKAGWPRHDILHDVFLINGWSITTYINVLYRDKFAIFGYLLTHPTDGVICYLMKMRDGDVAPGYVAPTGALWGLGSLYWFPDRAAFVLTNIGARSWHPSVYARSTLAANLYQELPIVDQQALIMLAFLDGHDLTAALDHNTATQDNATPLPMPPSTQPVLFSSDTAALTTAPEGNP